MPPAIRPVKTTATSEETFTRFSTVQEVARALRISKMTVYRLVKNGTLPAYRFGETSLRIPTVAVWNYMSGVQIDPQSVARAKALQ